MTTNRTPAMGGVRDVPVPDPIARAYLLLALRLDQHLPGTVDAYIGPADLKARVDMEQLRPAPALAEDAAALRARLAMEVEAADRRDWLDRQLTAIETLARVRAGESLGYLEQVTRCFAHSPTRTPEAELDRVAGELDALLPGPGSLADRLRVEDERWSIGADQLPTLAEHIAERHRARARELFDVPATETLQLSFVRGQPWSAYNWYEGGLRSRIDVNLDQPVDLPRLLGMLAHEAFPGHHLEHVGKEQALIEGAGRLEASVMLINAPECLISEGLAEAGRAFAVPDDELAGALVSLAPIAGLALADSRTTLISAAERMAAAAPLRRRLAAVGVNAALALHEDHWPRERVVAYLVEAGRLTVEAAEQRLPFIEHPMWRLYVHAYPEGEALVERWLAVVPDAERPARFSRLLHEQLTPPARAREAATAAGTAGAEAGATGVAPGTTDRRGSAPGG
jgi:hypothetical protein